jgi:sterol desaturase/sphingolipid hydroxylase (fatty acid hydroxylase superfamily)
MLPLKILIAGGWFALLALAERIAPAAQRPAGSDGPRQFRNLGLWAVNTLMNPFITVPIGAAATGLALWTRPALPGGLGLALDLLALDLWTYAWHRANHEWPLLWRFHRIHHRDEFLDTTSAVRFHPGEVILSALARAPLIIVTDIDIVSIVLFDAAVLIGALFHHSNLRLPKTFEAALRLLIVTPSHHWVHHHAVRADTDSNYAAILTVWDRVFGSWCKTARTPEMRIGVEGETDAPLPRLAVAPFVTYARVASR